MVEKVDFRYVAEYLKTNYPDECAFAISTANDAVNKRFIFNQRWDMERTWEYVEFEDEIDFLYQPGNDPEWIYAFNRLKHLISLGQAYHLTGEEKYAKAWKDQVKQWILTVKEDDKRNEKAWRTIETGIRLDTLSKSWLYFKDTKEAEEIHSLFISSIQNHADSILRRSWNSYHLMSNWGVLSNHGLYIAGVVFDRPEWEKEALYRLSMELKNEVYDDGSQWEQSPMYHNEVTRDYLDVLLFSRWGREKIEPWFYEKVKLLSYMNIKWMKPDGSEPMMGDSDDIDIRDVISESAFIFSMPEWKGISYKELEYETSWIVGMKGVEEYRSLASACPADLDYFLPDSGNIYSRTGWDCNADYVRFHNGTLGAGHGHADQTHFSIVNKGKDLIVDSGRYTYVAGEDRYRFKNNFAHNVVTVDGKSLYPEKDSWECYSLDKAINTRFASKAEGNIIGFEGGHLGYYREGVYINRRMLWLKNARLVVVIDEMYSDKKHSYCSRFNLAEGIEPDAKDGFVDIKEAKIYPRSFLDLDISSSNGQISRHYNQWEKIKALDIKVESYGFASIWSVIDLSNSNDLSVELKSVKSCFKGITFNSEQIEAIRITDDDRDYLVVSSHEEYATPTDTFISDECIGFGSLNVFNIKKGEKEIGTRVFF